MATLIKIYTAAELTATLMYGLLIIPYGLIVNNKIILDFGPKYIQNFSKVVKFNTFISFSILPK